MKIPKQPYTTEFKELAVTRVREGQSAGAVAKELGLIEQTLRNWVKAASVRIPCRRGSEGRRAVKASGQCPGFSQSQ